MQQDEGGCCHQHRSWNLLLGKDASEQSILIKNGCERTFVAKNCRKATRLCDFVSGFHLNLASWKLCAKHVLSMRPTAARDCEGGCCQAFQVLLAGWMLVAKDLRGDRCQGPSMGATVARVFRAAVTSCQGSGVGRRQVLAARVPSRSRGAGQQ